MGEGRWGFEDLDDREYEQISGRQPAGQPTEPEETGSGQDADRVVTVQIGLTGEVESVHLAADWKQAVDPRALGTSVLAAANTATAAAMVAQADRIDGPPPLAAAGAGAGAGAGADIDRTPLTRQDVNRLLEEVTADLGRFTRQIAEIAGARVSAESAGRHVSGTAQRGQVLEVSVDPGWAARSRTVEIESELVEVLRELRRRSTPDELAQRPQSTAIAELTALVADPATLLSRLRLGRHQQGTEGSNGR